jgi:hypothetical protein
MAENVEAPKQSLAEKILAIQAEAGAVKKKGKFDAQMGGGGYLRIEDAVVAVGKLMYQHKLLLSGTLLRKADGAFYLETHPHKIDKGYIVDVIVEWTLEDAESGEKRVWHFPGGGYDGTDKAVYKALTGSRKYAIIFIFNLAVGNDVEASAAPSFDESKNKAKAVAANKIAESAAKGNQTAIDAMSQIQPEAKLIIHRPEEMNGHYIFVGGLTAVPQLQAFFSDTGCKWLKNRTTGKDGWKVPAEYEKGLLALCEKLNIEVEG